MPVGDTHPGTDFTPFNADEGLILAARLPGSRQDMQDRRARGWDGLGDADEQNPLWIHLDRTKERAQRWIREEAELDPIVCDALLAEETRPRFQSVGDGLLVILRGVNMNPGARPDDLIAIRLWIEPARVITLRAHRFQTVVELRKRAEAGRAPGGVGAFLAALAGGVCARMAPSVDNLEDMLDRIESNLPDTVTDETTFRGALTTVRRQAISYRRFLVPQRDAILSLSLDPTPLLTPRDRSELRGVGEMVARIADDLEAIRDRAAVTQDEARSRREARMNARLYVLTIVATIAMPLGLITGLLGVNVGGIPLQDNPTGFLIVCVIMLALAVALLAFFRAKRML